MTGVIKVLLRLGRSGVVMVSATGGECRNAFDAYVIKWTSLAVGSMFHCATNRYLFKLGLD